ncbi:MAG: NADAR family protein [Alphaproteobacteria bacterium]|nr:MAG: NADAR family protein [Alphaproteobacteria bacterium]
MTKFHESLQHFGPESALNSIAMKTLLKPDGLVLIPETDDERAALARWKGARADFAFALADNSGPGAMLSALGPRAEACREPINVWSGSRDPQIALIANFAATPFELDGARYASVESFWQSLRFPPAERAHIAAFDGARAKQESEAMPYGSHIVYGDVEIPVGSHGHWQLMKRACRAKFTQNAGARAALLGTGTRPLHHQVRHDSRTIPGVIMADIWMAVRTMLRNREAEKAAGDAASSEDA